MQVCWSPSGGPLRKGKPYRPSILNPTPWMCHTRVRGGSADAEGYQTAGPRFTLTHHCGLVWPSGDW
jgi:hypothetical protein